MCVFLCFGRVVVRSVSFLGFEYRFSYFFFMGERRKGLSRRRIIDDMEMGRFGYFLIKGWVVCYLGLRKASSFF